MWWQEADIRRSVCELVKTNVMFSLRLICGVRRAMSSLYVSLYRQCFNGPCLGPPVFFQLNASLLKSNDPVVGFTHSECAHKNLGGSNESMFRSVAHVQLSTVHDHRNNAHIRYEILSVVKSSRDPDKSPASQAQIGPPLPSDSSGARGGSGLKVAERCHRSG